MCASVCRIAIEDRHLHGEFKAKSGKTACDQWSHPVRQCYCVSADHYKWPRGHFGRSIYDRHGCIRRTWRGHIRGLALMQLSSGGLSLQHVTSKRAADGLAVAVTGNQYRCQVNRRMT